MSDSDGLFHKGAKGRFVPGKSGNIRGRPPGSRNKLGETFLRAMAVDFEAHGHATIERLRRDRPEAYLRLCAGALPKLKKIPLSGAAELARWLDDARVSTVMNDIKLLKAEIKNGRRAKEN